jgi:hypothetical protein
MGLTVVAEQCNNFLFTRAQAHGYVVLECIFPEVGFLIWISKDAFKSSSEHGYIMIGMVIAVDLTGSCELTPFLYVLKLIIRSEQGQPRFDPAYHRVVSSFPTISPFSRRC